jgi:hypothetical protein
MATISAPEQPIDVNQLAQDILSRLAKLIVRGLTERQRAAALSDVGLSSHEMQPADELDLYLAMLALFKRTGTMDFIDPVVHYLGSIALYEDVAAELTRVRESVIAHRRLHDQRPFIFVLMPFTREHFALYEDTIAPVLTELGCDVGHAGDATRTVDLILDTIYQDIGRASFLVADTTTRNANVFYELGYAHALGKTAVLLTQDTKEIPFDLKGWRHIVYQPTAKNALAVTLRQFASKLLPPVPAKTT